jgi:hypothetical protein
MQWGSKFTFKNKKFLGGTPRPGRFSGALPRRPSENTALQCYDLLSLCFLLQKKRVYLTDFPTQPLNEDGLYVPVDVVYIIQPRELYVQFKGSGIWHQFKKSLVALEQVSYIYFQ